MRIRMYIAMLVLVPAMGWAQSPVQEPANRAWDAQGRLQDTLSESVVEPNAGVWGTNATTLAVLRANCPKDMAEAEWLKLMEIPANRVAFPLRLTQSMLDTLDGREMDLRFQYLFIPDQTQHHGPRVR